MLKQIVLAACAALVLTASPALADDDDDDRRGDRWHRHAHHDHGWHHSHGWYEERRHHRRARPHSHYEHRKHKHRKHKKKVVKHVYHYGHGHHGHKKHKKAKKKVYVEKHVYHHYPKRYGHAGHGHHGKHAHGRRHDDRDWAIFAILALQIVDVLNESQRHSYALAQQRATVAPLGESIRWNDGSARGQVIAVRDGQDSGGRYCREFQQEVVIGNQRRAGYGIACRQPDGAWEIVS